VAPGSFIAAVGADSQGNQEIEPELVASSTLVVDVLQQSAEIGRAGDSCAHPRGLEAGGLR
jgi:ornithine cyclodeaminase/alanine dehydrogenase-like protein (mu-crystallin family)